MAAPAALEEPWMSRLRLLLAFLMVQAPLPADWKAAWGPAQLYDIAYLACGHTVARRAS